MVPAGLPVRWRWAGSGIRARVRTVFFAGIVDQSRRQVAIVRELQMPGIFLGRREFGMMLFVEASDVETNSTGMTVAFEMLIDGLVAARAGRVVHPQQRGLRGPDGPGGTTNSPGLDPPASGGGARRPGGMPGILFGAGRAAFPAPPQGVVSNRMEIRMAGRALRFPRMMDARQASRRVEGGVLVAQQNSSRPPGGRRDDRHDRCLPLAPLPKTERLEVVQRYAQGARLPVTGVIITDYQYFRAMTA